MSDARRPIPLRILTTTLALMPWVASMWLFWWLDASGTWTPETPHRGKFSVMLMGTGMVVSFLLLTRFGKRTG